MKILLTLIIIISGSLQAKSQISKSDLYNEKGQLFADTTLSISNDQYKCWTCAEDNLVAYFSTIEFPTIYLENNIRQKDKLLVSFICDSLNIHEIKVLNDSSAYATAVIEGLVKKGKIISRVLKECSSRYTSRYSTVEFKGKYYLAISFEIIDFKETMIKLKAVPIIKSSVPLYSYGID